MRLINTKTLELLNFSDKEVPGYAILSHTWGTEEVTQHELLALTPQIRSKAGFQKISKFCELALQEGHDLAWVDTCCIDKTSSAELSEAINSMYNWYQQARMCYAFLADVPAAMAFSGDDPVFEKSRWFTRGWTLQELLAPQDLVFFSAEWHKIGTKTSLSEEISKATGIDKDILIGETDVQTVSIASRMSWAARRNTTRTEDIAYCLMGIFDINMPMLYGEGQKAFVRLQEEIVRNTEDHSIFAWEDPEASDDELRGLLAPHPRCFRTTGDFQPVLAPDPEANLVAVTNRGISFHVLHYTTEADGLTATLNCTEANSTNSFAYIHLLPLDEAGSKSARVRSHKLGRAPRRGNSKPTVVSQKPRIPSAPKALRGHQWFTVDKLTLPRRITIGADHLAFFTVSGESSIRPMDGVRALSSQESRPFARIRGPPSDYLFQVPQKQHEVALSLHLTAQGSMGFPYWYHAKIDIGIGPGVDFAIAALSAGEGDEEEYSDQDEGEATLAPQRFADATPLPATVAFKLEDPMIVVAALSWKEKGGETVACISLDVRDESDKVDVARKGFFTSTMIHPI